MRPQDSPQGADNLAKSMAGNSRRGQAKKWHGEDTCALSLCSLCLVLEVIWEQAGEGLASNVEDSAWQEGVKRVTRRNLSSRRSLAPYCQLWIWRKTTSRGTWWPLKVRRDKKSDSSLKPPKEHSPSQTYESSIDPFHTSDLQNWKIINLHHFKSWGLWNCIIAAIED